MMINFRHAILLAICAHLVTSAPIIAKRSLNASKITDLVVLLNEQRVTRANVENIGNMHELTYDKELEKVAKTMANDCKFPHGPYVLVSQGSENLLSKLFHPLQTKIGCILEMSKPCPTRGIEQEFCLMGPYSSSSTEKDVKTGPLGSHCKNGLADNGLCKAGSGNAPTSSNNEEYVKRANDIRVQHAKEKNIGNMHEMTFDPELEKLAHTMGIDCKFHSGSYVLVGSEDYSKWIIQSQNPVQTKFACVELVAPCLERNMSGLFCLFGPQTSPVNEKDIKTGPLGSHCKNGVADNGLCKAGSGNVTFSNSMMEFLIKTINEMRVVFAKEHQIGNEHELTWDPELEKIAHQMEADCKFPSGPYVFISWETPNESEEREDKKLEPLMHPLQTKVVCIELAAPCPNSERNFCLIGPYNTPTTEKDMKTGPLGSHCKNGVADNGLCKAK